MLTFHTTKIRFFLESDKIMRFDPMYLYRHKKGTFRCKGVIFFKKKERSALTDNALRCRMVNYKEV